MLRWYYHSCRLWLPTVNQGRSSIFKIPDQRVSSKREAKLSHPGRQSCRSKNLEVGRNQLNMSDPQKVAARAGGMVPRLRVPAAKSSDSSLIPTVLVVGENWLLKGVL